MFLYGFGGCHRHQVSKSHQAKKKTTTKAYSLIKGTSQIQSEDLKIKQPPPPQEIQGKTRGLTEQDVRCDRVSVLSWLSKCHLE